MRSAAHLKMGYYPLPESEGKGLRALLSFAGPASVIDACVGQGTALKLVTIDFLSGAAASNFMPSALASPDPKASRPCQGNTFDTIVKPEPFSLLFLNPTLANRQSNTRVAFLPHSRGASSRLRRQWSWNVQI